MSAPDVISLSEKLASISEHWSPHIVGAYNGNELRIAKVQGDFTWHSHSETDELFLVVAGEMGIEFRDGVKMLRSGEMLVVPKGTEHRPFAEKEAHIVLIDREGESNTGDTPSYRTKTRLEVL